MVIPEMNKSVRIKKYAEKAIRSETIKLACCFFSVQGFSLRENKNY